MSHKRRRAFRALSMLGVVALSLALISCSSYPNPPIVIVVPDRVYDRPDPDGPGGSGDPIDPAGDRNRQGGYLDDFYR